MRDVVAGALVGALLFEALKHGFAFYLRNFTNYDAIYGSLGAAIALLFFVYLAACVLLFGAEIAAEWPRVMYGHTTKRRRRSVDKRCASECARRRLGSWSMINRFLEEPDEEARAARLERRQAERSERLGGE